MKLSVIIPAYNEENRIVDTLHATSEFLSKQSFAYEMIVVVDGAKDRTAAVVEEAQKEIPHLTLLNNPENHGKGHVVKQGMLAATGDFRLFMDADNSTTIDQVIPMFDYIDKGYGVVIGSIEIPGAKVNEHAQWYRRFLGHWSKYLIRVVAGLWSIHDTQRGFKLFTGKAAEAIFSRVTIERFGFDIEVLAVAKKLGFRIKEVPVIWNNAGASTVSLNSYFATFGDLVRVRMNLWTGKYR